MEAAYEERKTVHDVRHRSLPHGKAESGKAIKKYNFQKGAGNRALRKLVIEKEKGAWKFLEFLCPLL